MTVAANIEVGEVPQPGLVRVLGHLHQGPLASREDHAVGQLDGAGQTEKVRVGSQGKIRGFSTQSCIAA